jgi:hypothetical protein
MHARCTWFDVAAGQEAFEEALRQLRSTHNEEVTVYEKSAERAIADQAAERDRSPIEIGFQRVNETLEKANALIASLEGGIESVLAPEPPPSNKVPLAGVETPGGSKLELELARLHGQAQGLVERIVTVIDRVRL